MKAKQEILLDAGFTKEQVDAIYKVSKMGVIRDTHAAYKDFLSVGFTEEKSEALVTVLSRL